MSHSSKSLLLEDEIGLLVRHFGVKRVKAALAKVPINGDEVGRAPSRKAVPHGHRVIRTGGANALEPIRESEPEKHRLLSEFLLRLNGRQVLPESQDIRHFAQIVGLKDIDGKSRKDMIPKMMRFLMDLPVERLRVSIDSAGSISEQQRQMGFSILTDKLIGKP
jgi:hypothetical protein